MSMISHLASSTVGGKNRPPVGRPSRVVTLTPSPVADRNYFLEKLRPGQVNRAAGVRFHLGGNGVNVARTLELAGCQVRAVLPLAAADDPGDVLLGQHPRLFHRVTVPAPMRVNTVLITEDGITTNANAPAGPLEDEAWTRVVDQTLEQLAAMQADWLLLAGAMPRLTAGGPLPIQNLFKGAKALGARICIDVNGAELLPLVETGLVDLAKPNATELAQSCGTDFKTMGDVLSAARWLQSRGAGAVMASMGEDGLIAVAGRQAASARAIATRVVNTTGAGDAALAGLLSRTWAASDPASFGAAVVRAASWGALAVAQPTAELRSLHGAPEARLYALDPSQPLAACSNGS